MATRGRKPKNPALKVLRGGGPSSATGSTVGSTSTTEPAPPADLTPEQLAEWHRLAGEIRQLGTLATTDRALLGQYVEAWDRLQQARRAIELHGLVLETPLGGVKGNPAATVAAQAQNLMLRILAELGLTPSARARLAKPEAPRDELADFLSTTG